MTDYPDNPGPLPAEKLRNAGDGDDALGALGNEAAGKMCYTGGDREDLVRILQGMLRDLGYDIGNFGPGGDGVDGVFGNRTEEAAKKFQGENKDWDGSPLKVDGLVGPRTSDALNRKMVGIWYDHYQTPAELVEGLPYHTITSKSLGEGLGVKPEGARKARVFIVGEIVSQNRNFRISAVLYSEIGRSPLANAAYRLHLDDGVAEGVTDADGSMEKGGLRPGDYLLEVAGSRTYVPAIPPAMERLGWMVLGTKAEDTGP